MLIEADLAVNIEMRERSGDSERDVNALKRAMHAYPEAGADQNSARRLLADQEMPVWKTEEGMQRRLRRFVGEAAHWLSLTAEQRINIESIISAERKAIALLIVSLEQGRSEWPGAREIPGRAQRRFTITAPQALIMAELLAATKRVKLKVRFVLTPEQYLKMSRMRQFLP